MKIRFLGYAGSIQHREAGNVSLVVSSGDSSVLVDVSGSPVTELKRAQVDPMGLDLVVVTHTHIDHLYAFPSLLHQLWLMGKKDSLVVVGNSDTITLLKELYDLFRLGDKKDMFPVRWEVCREGRSRWHVGTLDLECFSVCHGVPTIGCAVTEGDARFVYLADGSPAPDYPSCAYDATLLVHEAGGLAEEEASLASKGHSSALQAGNVAKRLGARRLLLCHLPEDTEMQRMLLEEAESVCEHTRLPVLYQAYEI